MMLSLGKMLEVILIVLYAVLLGVLAVAIWRLRYAYNHFGMGEVLTPNEARKLPSVTVCIPARNEVHAMNDCLEKVIASTYEKLEIIVLDDVSGDDTPALIKAFASKGVRFVEGTPLPDGWLGKNHALQELLEEASGSYVLFMDVDTRLAPDSIEQLVRYTEHQKALMVSVLPRREDGLRASVLFSTLRYFWEIMFHRVEAPATASNLWLIDRKTLRDRWHGFKDFKEAIQPESRFSAALMANGKYRFIFGTQELGISYEKKWRSQASTSIRLMFPLLASKVSHGIIATLDLLIVGSPLLVILSGFAFGWGMNQVIAGIFVALYAVVYALYLKQVRKHGWLLGAVLWPIVAIQEAVLVVMSIIQYKRQSVTWKGRSVRAQAPQPSVAEPHQ